MWQLNKHNTKNYKKNLIDTKLKNTPKALTEINFESLELEIIKMDPINGKG